ncbi:hypothetical protein WICANDRAFT_85887 [Wickerhamomyces anomalus NRRL Y-366-8]|uniref:Carbonic anhydrase n=1 Tax=Wickerhamomyces anomalus (strain ATCC 58044 / CBS 1984 / NCYC 433 / NRRL Y-366-8) TaxID=683960 RepID=A0A1E3NX87_WICAA|nr:uncharacterized protein WICANDRAFT_85887 [Wickerhamomyces anomalus NRRL Y-366-8]ODQ57809.1 hypothetical protein WICANDRAFT_85887 [Wickerhamomyces anomalus NRRL Y-366-8]
MSNASQFEINNKEFTKSFTQGSLPLPPSKKVAVLTCMDARLDPAKVLGIEIGEAHVIRNAGGRSIDGLRSLIISQRLLGTREIVLIHHTDCGMLTFKDDDLRNQLVKETGELVDHWSFLPFDDLKKSVIDDLEFLKKHPLILDVPITGYVYHVEDGSIEKVY